MTAFKDVLITTAGVAGLLGVVWILCAPLFGLSIVIFETGSMAPTMPEGAAALVRVIPAAEIEVGDVVTVDRAGSALPVTHRVVSVSTASTHPGGRSVTLKGDANAVPDLSPYDLTQAKLVVAAAPGVGAALTELRTPYFLAFGTLLIALLVVWAFWPSGTLEFAAHRGDSRARL